MFIYITTNKLKNYAKKLELNKNIFWIENYINIKDIYNITDLFVLTSRYEGLGLVLLEAVNFSVPVVANNTSSIPEVIKNKHSGILLNNNSSESFAKEINNFIKKKIIIKKSNFKLFNSKFNYLKMCKLTLNLYKSLFIKK